MDPWSRATATACHSMAPLGQNYREGSVQRQRSADSFDMGTMSSMMDSEIDESSRSDWSAKDHILSGNGLETRILFGFFDGVSILNLSMACSVLSVIGLEDEAWEPCWRGSRFPRLLEQHHQSKALISMDWMGGFASSSPTTVLEDAAHAQTLARRVLKCQAPWSSKLKPETLSHGSRPNSPSNSSTNLQSLVQVPVEERWLRWSDCERARRLTLNEKGVLATTRELKVDATKAFAENSVIGAPLDDIMSCYRLLSQFSTLDDLLALLKAPSNSMGPTLAVITLLIAKLMYTCPWVLDASGDFERLYPPAPELVQLLEGCRKPGSIEARALFDGIAVAAWGFESASACASASSAQCAAHSPRPTSFVVMLERWSLGQLHNFRARDTRTATTTSLQEMAALLVTTLKEERCETARIETTKMSPVTFLREAVRVSGLFVPMGCRAPRVSISFA
mmetsp:Transcript_51813/g.144660  ORF Transcript_51813/g.144660 Transcript_51813/m.144660 type:complete len:451 (-) Transcript_51813:324-1676(-)